MLQRLAVTNPKNDKMDPHGVNPTLSIFFPTPFPVAMQGLGDTASGEKDLRLPCLEIIVLTNWKTGIGLSNNHEEADIKIFMVSHAQRSLYNHVIIKSTDSDILFIFLTNAEIFNQKIYSLFSPPGSTQYLNFQKLVQLIQGDVDPVIQIRNS